jgi:hypothetical protein
MFDFHKQRDIDVLWDVRRVLAMQERDYGARGPEQVTVYRRHMAALTEAKSTLERPPKHLLKTFKVWQIGKDTVETYLRRGYSLAICCQDCPRMQEWTPPELEQRFPLTLKIADLAERLSCKGESGCGSKDVAVFPHKYDQPWRWTPPQGGD